MASIKGTFDTISGLVGTITDLALRLIVALLVVDVLFPASSEISENIGRLVGQFGDNGLAGLIAILLFLLLYKNR
ncbi:MAG TPA: hypothetical protein EYM78_03850 [Gemmatimonadetes bacterium]|nr:hypothetical protein [Gemmatimonadota bacterium]